jgi:hypothetical protein
MAGFVAHPAMLLKKWCCSSFEVNGVLFGVKLSVAGREALGLFAVQGVVCVWF